MATARLFDGDGKQKGTVELPASLFAQPVHKQALYEVVRNYLANQRQGTHDTKTRAEVDFSGKKLYKQKGTGRARAGDAKSPTRVGGGVAFGPHPRDYGYKVQRKVKRKALTSALSDRAGAERVTVVEDLRLEAPKTPKMAALLRGPAAAGPPHPVRAGGRRRGPLEVDAQPAGRARAARERTERLHHPVGRQRGLHARRPLAGAEEVFGK